MALFAVAKTQGTPTYKRYYHQYDPRYRPSSAFLRDLNYYHASTQLSKMSYFFEDHFLSNDSNYNDIRKLREYPRLVYKRAYLGIQPPTQPFYIFVVSGKGWEIWRLKPETLNLIEDRNYHLCLLIARSAADNEIDSPSRIVFTDAFYRKSGRVSFYVKPQPHSTFVLSFMVFYPLEGLDGTQGFVGISQHSARFVDSDYFTYGRVFYYPTIDDNTVLILPKPEMLKIQPLSTPSVPDGSIHVATKNAVFAHYEGVPMNGKVIAPLNVTSGQITVPRKKLVVTIYRGLNFWEEDANVIEAPKLGCGIWALPSEDPNAKLDGYNYYSLNDIDAELVEQHIFDFFEPQVTFKVSSRDDRSIFVGVSRNIDPFYSNYLSPAFQCKTPSAEVVSLPVDRVYQFYLQGAIVREDGRYAVYGGVTNFSENYLFYNLVIPIAYITSVTEGALIPEQKNKDTRLNVAVGYGIPKDAELKAMTSYLNPSFVVTAPYFRGSPAPHTSSFTSFNLNELLANAPTIITVGEIGWAHYNNIFHPVDNLSFFSAHMDMPIGAYEVVSRSNLSSTDRGRGRETVKVLVWQPMWFSHSFTADPNYGDILATFGFKVITIASPPRVEYVVGGLQVCSAWFQNLLKRLRGTELKDVEKALLRDCVASLDGFFGAIRVTFHYDKQTRLVYMREWRLGVPFGDPVPLTTFNLQPYHEIRALKDFWSWSLYLDIIDARTQTIVKRIRIVPTVRSWIVGEVNPSQPVAFTQRKSFANPLVGVNPSSPYIVDRNLNFNQVIGRNPHALISSTLTNINPQVYKQGNYPTRFYPLQAPVTSLRGIPTQYQTAAQKFYGSQVPVVPIQFGNLNAQPIYVATIPITMEIRAKRDVPYEIIAKWGVGVAIFAAGTQWSTLLPYGLADLGDLLHWTVIEFWEDQP